MKIKLLFLAINIAFLVNFVDHSKVQDFRDQNTKQLESVFSEATSSNKFEQFSIAFQNRFQHHLENLKENLGADW